MARAMMDYKRDADGKLVISGGDFVVVESTAEHQKSIVLDAQGEYMASPNLGVNAPSYIDDDAGTLARDVVQQFMADGMEVKGMTVNGAGWVDNTVKLFPNAYYP